jgi:hypothetical protein
MLMSVAISKSIVKEIHQALILQALDSLWQLLAKINSTLFFVETSNEQISELVYLLFLNFN